MLRKKALNRIYLTTLVLFIMLVSFTFEFLAKPKNNILTEVEYVANLNKTYIYLLNKDNYLVKVDIVITESNQIKKAYEILNNLYVDNKKYPNLRGIIPNNTKINNILIENKTIIVDFSKDLLKVNKYLEEKVIESIVYSLLELDNIENVKITIAGDDLLKLTKSNKNLPILLDNTFGINKNYAITSLKDCQKVVLYYGFTTNDKTYYVPVTKYVNSFENKIKIIIDTLQGNYLGNTTLKSYLNKNNQVQDFQVNNDILTITFNTLNNDTLEEVTYSLASSVFNSTDTKKIIFEFANQIIAIKEAI